MGSGLLATRRCAWPWAVLASMFLVCISAAVASTQQASYCKLTILGSDEGTLQQASMTCTGSATSTITLNSTYLGRFTANFTGVNLAPTCQAAFSCLITVCTGTIVLHDSSVSWVSQLPLKNLVCVVHDSRLEVHDSFIVNNQVRPFALADNASLLLHASNISNNVATSGSGGGLYVSDHTRVDIEGGSRIQNNTANRGLGNDSRGRCSQV